mmetsp:Transcript_24103/g.29194  ORF Transcript_24103/g.29194 Transcript_24103/m.29194 type:complete len:405 (+) Transcript_24103:72-1286(+)|eukprot:CAMPEP_0197847394 /NCGR_PEP_ID=MMETSP1438-20131217/5953_1 /TAXON_ID=1461541 /ORGANISM="Pterosperma sp., Strain CCMP1384" /LENGTH=404 /DNA_ID=CAMNT_0043459297 /DNA_START=71 /DNA_END=1285 /DNA_ORIENTATION=+
MKCISALVLILAVSSSAREIADVDPNCKAELAAAAGKIKTAESALTKANDEFAADAAKYAKLLKKESDQVQKDAESHNVSYKKLDGAVGNYNDAKNNYLNLNNTYYNLKGLCASPTPPSDCSSKLATARRNVDHARTAEAHAARLVTRVKAVINATQAKLVNDQETLTADSRTKDTALELDQTDIETAKKQVGYAQDAYNAIVNKCRGGKVVGLEQTESNRNCPHLIKRANQTLVKAVAAEATADKAHAAVDSYWLPFLKADADAVKKASDAKNAADNKVAPASAKENTALQAWQDAKNALVAQQTACAQPVKPKNCDELIENDKADVSNTELAFNEARIALSDIYDDIKVENAAFDQAIATQSQDFATHKKALSDAEDAVVAARKGVQDAQQNYNAVVAECRN